MSINFGINIMYDPQLEKLITMALNDGIITEKERQILLKKAVDYGIDPDDFEMELEFRLGKLTPQSNSVMNIGNDNVVKTVINATTEVNVGQPNFGQTLMNMGNDNVVTAHIDASNKVNIASQTIINQNKEQLGAEYIKLLTSGKYLKLNNQVIKQMINNFPSDFHYLPELLNVLTESYAFISGHWINHVVTHAESGLGDFKDLTQHFKVNSVLEYTKEILIKIKTVISSKTDKNLLECLKNIEDMIIPETFFLTLSDSLFYALVSLNENSMHFHKLISDFKKQLASIE